MKDRNLRKAFTKLVNKLGGFTDERFYHEESGVHGIENTKEKLKKLQNDFNKVNYEVFGEEKKEKGDIFEGNNWFVSIRKRSLTERLDNAEKEIQMLKDYLKVTTQHTSESVKLVKIKKSK